MSGTVVSRLVKDVRIDDFIYIKGQGFIIRDILYPESGKTTLIYRTSLSTSCIDVCENDRVDVAVYSYPYVR